MEIDCADLPIYVSVDENGSSVEYRSLLIITDTTALFHARAKFSTLDTEERSLLSCDSALPC